MADVEGMFDDDSEGQYSDDDTQSHGARRRRQYSDEEEEELGDDLRSGRQDDDDDDDRGDYDRRKQGSKKDPRRKRPRTNNFLDIEASVDTDEEEEDDDEGALEGFIVDNDDELAIAERDALRHRSEARPAMFQDETMDADAIEAQLRERYSGYAASGKRGAAPAIDAEWVPQRLIIPGINDPHLWMARCSAGKERDIVLAAARRVLQWASSGKFNGVYSIYCRDGLSGYIYVEARSQADAQSALEGIPGAFAFKQTLVPIEDMVDVVKVKSQAPKLNPGSWARVRRGNYAGDLAQVVSVIESSDAVEVRLLPRLDYNAEGRSKKHGTRPPQRLFSVEDAQRADSRTLSSRQNEILWKGDRFINGYLHKDMRFASLQLENVKPTLEEIAKFAVGEAGEDGDEQAAIAALANQAAAASSTMNGIEEANGLSGRDLQPGEKIEVVEGDLAGVVGVVRSVEDNNIIRIEPELSASRRGGRMSTMTLPARELRKRFSAGDHVKVLNGRHSNETGMVLEVNDAVVTVFTDIGKGEIRVLAKDLRVSSDIGTSTGGTQTIMVGLDVNDLVHLEGNQMGVVLKVSRDSLTVLDDRNEVRTMAPRSARPTRGNFERTGVDFGGNPITRGDVVREASGARRQGTVVQVTRFVTFVKSRDSSSSDNMFAVRTRQVESMSARQGSLDPYATRNMRSGTDNGRGRGRGRGRVGSLRGGRDPLVGKTVIANRGPYKGYVGIVKDIAGTQARIELHTNARVVNVDKDKLSVRLPSGETVPVVDYTNSMQGEGSAPRGRESNRDTGDSGWGGSNNGDSGWSGGGGNSSSWGAPPVATPRGGYSSTRDTANSPAPSYGGWDGAGASAGGWNVATPSSGGGGWDTGSNAGTSGWGAPSAQTTGNWGTPGPFTPGALPQTPGGPFPQTPGTYDAPTPGARPTEGTSDAFFGWAVPKAMVVLGSTGQRATIKEVAAGRQQAIVQLETGGTQVIDRHSVTRIDPRPVRAEKKDRVVVIRGSRKGALGTMVGKDGSEAFFQADGQEAWHPEPLRNLAIYNDRL
ncbi:transcription elongation factor spt5 [Coemansia sp. RSA 520]|nr:transcription elongation factor spt5 [Coemansia sp. RSA 564]KAJ2187612.1 transcription elongation factor spt5 [Coemansia sp. RSA 532]KAJ2222433.1 transcription elongation factor spt5 [Coemansia sp. RSA 520]KAJ2273238.1 transcription elongation factor spt5 [Coemansia sp. RSA 371]KAJ2288461.1 transcription elongation factor spt5 [Coemansia sp. RSA 355]KAJ2410301.1 transcription elongation factor spt5 [Coemansia sp. RSA 2526]KAJ2434110.1 transcription elongation factor spt5 [Coemansia sp. RSA